MRIGLSGLRQIIREELMRESNYPPGVYSLPGDEPGARFVGDDEPEDLGDEVSPDEAPPWDDEDYARASTAVDADGFEEDYGDLDDEPSDAELSRWEDEERERARFDFERSFGDI